jgi:hypothetical protein
MSLHSLVYASLAKENFTDEKLEQLLQFARAKNEKQDITGMLLYRDGIFVQALEGEEKDIDTLFEKIKRDTRHKEIVLVTKQPIKQRSFPDWTMGFKVMDQETLKQMEGFTEFLTKPTPSFFAGAPSCAKALLDNFKHDALF